MWLTTRKPCLPITVTMTPKNTEAFANLARSRSRPCRRSLASGQRGGFEGDALFHPVSLAVLALALEWRACVSRRYRCIYGCDRCFWHGLALFGLMVALEPHGTVASTCQSDRKQVRWSTA